MLLAAFCMLHCVSADGTCPATWDHHGENCYKRLDKTAETFAKARDACASEGGTVVSLADTEEANFVYNMITGRLTWLGLRRTDTENENDAQVQWVFTKAELDEARSKAWEWEDGSKYK